MSDIAGKAIGDAFAAEIANALGITLNAAASMAPIPAAAGAAAGWLVSTAASGNARGTLTAWIEHEALSKALKAARGLAADPDAAAITASLVEVVTEAALALGRRPTFDGMTLGTPSVQPGSIVPGMMTYVVQVTGLGPCRLAIAAELELTTSADGASNDRLQAVLEVDLPLVVRFGRATMPLKTLAGLVSGSMVDMHRSPDDPVEFLVGDRVIARGEVVIVGGNYGVRITELLHHARSAAALEA